MGEKPLVEFARVDYLSALNELAYGIREDEIPKLSPEKRPDAVRMALGGKRVLIILDHLDKLHESDQDRLFQFLSRLPEGNKAIVTHRDRADVDARIVRLDGLQADEALKLMVELTKTKPLLADIKISEFRHLYEVTHGNPLFIKWVFGQLGQEGSQLHNISETLDFIKNIPKNNDPLEYIFGDLLATFTENETKVLAALTYFTQPAKLDWLAQMTDLPLSAAETALEDLTDRSIPVSNLESRTFYLPPLAATFIRTRRPEAVAKTGYALTNRAYALAMQYGGSTNYEGFKTLDAEWNLLAAALPRLLQGDNGKLQDVCSQLFQFFIFTGRWDEWIWLCKQAEERALAAGDKDNAGWRAYHAGYTYNFRNQAAEVLACAERATAYWEGSTFREKGAAIRLRGFGYWLQKDYPAAIAAFHEVLEIWRTLSFESIDVSYALADLANVERENKDYNSSERDYREALRISKKNNDQEGIATRLGNLAELALDREQWAEAEGLAREALALAEKVGRLELIASNCHRLAIALLKQNKNLDEALSLSRRAVEIYTRLKSPSLQSAQKTLAQIEETLKK